MKTPALYTHDLGQLIGLLFYIVNEFHSFYVLVGRGPYNWLTQNSLDVSSSSLMDISSVDEDGGRSSSGQSSLLFTVGRSTGGKKLQSKAVPPDFGRERLGKKEKETDESTRENMKIYCFLHEL